MLEQTRQLESWPGRETVSQVSESQAPAWPPAVGNRGLIFAMTNIRDVARQAGVSISTVSRVLNGTANVNSDIRKRVAAAMEDLAYQPNSAARSLRTNRSRIIGLLISDIQNPFFMGLIRGVEELALRH